MIAFIKSNCLLQKPLPQIEHPNDAIDKSYPFLHWRFRPAHLSWPYAWYACGYNIRPWIYRRGWRNWFIRNKH